MEIKLLFLSGMLVRSSLSLHRKLYSTSNREMGQTIRGQQDTWNTLNGQTYFMAIGECTRKWHNNSCSWRFQVSMRNSLCPLMAVEMRIKSISDALTLFHVSWREVTKCDATWRNVKLRDVTWIEVVWSNVSVVLNGLFLVVFLTFCRFVAD